MNNTYVFEGKTKCFHSVILHLCVEKRLDRVIALIMCVCVEMGDRDLAVINNIRGNGRPSVCTNE